MPSRRVRSRCALPALLLVLACSGTYYDAYRAEHPGWSPSLPQVTGGVAEVVAALHAPSAVEGLHVENVRLEILPLGPPPWHPVPAEALGDGRFRPDPDADYAVLAVRRCRFDEGLRVREEERTAYYLLRAGRLAGYDHVEFGARCGVRDQFFAARGDDVPLESELSAYILEHVGRRHLDLPQTYRRGLGYVEAGRLQEARAIARLAEGAYRAAALQAQQRGTRSPAFDEVERLRDRLHRALGMDAGPAR